MAEQHDMRALIEGLGAQMIQALEAPVEQAPTSAVPFRGVAILGMGGSGIGGAIMADALRAEAEMPVVAVSDQALPGWVTKGCLVVASSYSGNTEETLACTEEAVRRGCTMAVVTSGGQLLERAVAQSWPVVRMPGGPPPRSQFGRSFLGLAKVLHAHGVFDCTFLSRNLLSNYREQKQQLLRTSLRLCVRARDLGSAVQ